MIDKDLYVPYINCCTVTRPHLLSGYRCRVAFQIDALKLNDKIELHFCFAMNIKTEILIADLVDLRNYDIFDEAALPESRRDMAGIHSDLIDPVLLE
jgi:hypothetical protein